MHVRLSHTALLSLLLCCLPTMAQVMRFEAEDWTTPKSAWEENKNSDTKWNLWSTDKDAKKKWSEGIVLRSPRVMENRKTGAEGAPVLHTVITGIPEGSYDIELGGTGRYLGVSLDGKTWTCRTGGLLVENQKIGKDGKFELWVDDRFAMEAEERRGSGYYDYLEFSKTGPEMVREILGDGTLVKGHAHNRHEENLGRGLLALRKEQGVYLSWRLLKKDTRNTGFHVWRVEKDGTKVKLTEQPRVQTCDFFDANAPAGEVSYLVLPATTSTRIPGDETVVSALPQKVPCLSFKLKDETTTFQKVAVVDLDGDGLLDYVLKTPNSNIDPAGTYWKPSTQPYVLQAYRHDGTFLWEKSLGWAIESGIWYSPLVVWDLDGDGRAEVAAKIGEGDPRDAEGKVREGPEWLAVFAGDTGKEITRVPWPSRDGFSRYSLTSRNQMAVAYLDGKTPCLIALRGTYKLMKVEAWELLDGKLRPLWSYNNEKLPRRYRGQGAHFTRCFDADNDGRDEILLGSLLLDDNGIPLWTTGMGHPDFCYVGDHNPENPGLEICYGIETRARKNGMSMVDMKTGEFIWGFDGPTRHIHGKGMCADIDPNFPGREGFFLDCTSKRPDIRRGPWLWSAAGELLWFESDLLPKTYSLEGVFWDADLQKEVFRRARISDYRGGIVDSGFTGSTRMIADITGDWREELIASVPGELRIYSSTIPATDRRVCLLQDRNYRSETVMNSMGYTVVPMTSYLLTSYWPALTVTTLENDDAVRAEIVVSAPLTASVKGSVSLQLNTGTSLSPAPISVDLAPGKHLSKTFPIPFGNNAKKVKTTVQAEFAGTISYQAQSLSPEIPRPADFATSPGGSQPLRLKASSMVRLRSKPQTGGIRAEAENFVAQNGGKVHLRTDKPGVVGKAISHWDDSGHWLEWELDVPKKSNYTLILRYATPTMARRQLSIDGEKRNVLTLSGSGGFGNHKSEWQNHKQIVRLEAGKHRIRLENIDQKGVNLDYLLLETNK